MKQYKTVTSQTGAVDAVLNEALTQYEYIKLEDVTKLNGTALLVTYSFDTDEELGWLASAYTVKEGTKIDAAETCYAYQWFNTEEEAYAFHLKEKDLADEKRRIDTERAEERLRQEFAELEEPKGKKWWQ